MVPEEMSILERCMSHEFQNRRRDQDVPWIAGPSREHAVLNLHKDRLAIAARELPLDPDLMSEGGSLASRNCKNDIAVFGYRSPG